MKSLKYLNKYFRKYRFNFFLGFVFVVLGNIFALFPAHLIGKSFDLISQEINKSKFQNSLDYDSLYYFLSIYAGLLILFALIRGVFMFYMRQNIIVASRHIEYDLKNEIYTHYQNLSFNFYTMNESGDLLNRLTEDVTKVRMYLGPALMYSLNLFTLIILIVSRMLIVSPELTLIVLTPLPILSFLIYKVSHVINYKSSLVQKKLSSLTNSVQATFSGIRLVKSFVREKEIINDFNKISKEYMNHSISLSRINSVFFPLVLLLVGVSILLTVYMGGVLVVKELITVGKVAEFIIYVNMLTWPATSIGWVTEVVQRAAASQTRINEFLEKQDYTRFFQTKNNNVKHKYIIDTISFNNLSYRYNKSNLLALDSINLNIEVNSIIGFVGHVGSGKSTIVKILCGVLKPTKGQLLFDNNYSTNFNWNEVRDSISYVSQDVFLFSDSIKKNILFGIDGVSDLELLKLAENLCILKEIQSFTNGFDTQIGEGGLKLSGGQKQRIALARALIRQPKLLLLDDPLSNVDSETELKIMNYIKSNFKNTTIILTSNKVSVLNFCTKLFVLKSGNLIQEGLHKELISIEGEYQNLFFNQMLLK